MADTGSQQMELLFFDTFTHEMTEELNLDLVQFPCPVIIYEIRVIPLRTQVQADLPGGVRLGATNPSSFKLELFVNNLNKPNSSTFENIGVLQYKENNIQLKPNEDVPTDGLIIKGWYNAITLAVIGTLTTVAPKPERSSPPPPPPPAQPPRAKVESRPVEPIKPDHRPHPPPQQQHPLDYIQQQIQLQQVQQQQRFQQQSAAAGHPVQPSPTPTPPLIPHPHPPQPQSDFRHGDHRDPLAYPPRPGHDARDRREPIDRSNFPPEPKEPYEQRESHDERSRDSYDWEYRGRRSSRDSRERSQSRESSREPRDYRDSRDRDIDRERSSRDRDRDRDSRDRESDRDRGRERDWERERDRERELRERDHERERDVRERELRDRELREREIREAREREIEREMRERDRERQRELDRERDIDRPLEADDRDGRPKTPPQPRLRSESPNRAIPKSPGGSQQPTERRIKDEDVESGELEEELYESLSDENSPAVFQQSEAEPDNDILDEDRASYDDISSEDDMVAAEVDELQGIELYDISEDPWNFITSSFNPLQSELVPLECYDSPALCKFEVEKTASDILDISDKPPEAQSIIDLMNLFSQTPHHDKWVESMESLPSLFDNGLTYLIIKEDNKAVVEKILEWTLEGVDLDKAMKQPESAFKVRHLKMGIKLTGALTTFSPDFAKELILMDIQHKLINLFVSPYMAFSVKLLIVQALDKTVRFIDGLKWFLGTHTNQISNKQTCYQRVLEIMMGKQLVRTTVALSCFLKKIHVFEVLKNFSRIVSSIVNNAPTNEESEETKTEEPDLEIEQALTNPICTKSELTNIVNCLEEIYKVLVLAPDMIGQTNRSLPTCPPFDKGDVMYDPYPGLFYMFDHCGFLNSLFVLISTPSILSQTPIYHSIENIFKQLLHSQNGLLYLASHYDLTNNIIRSLVQIHINDDNEENVEEGPGKNLGIEMIYHLQVIMLLDQLRSYHNKHDSSIIIDDTEAIMCLQTLYSMTFTSIGLEAVVKVLAMDDNLDALIPFVKAEDDKKKELRRSKSVCTAFATELLRVLIKNSTNIKMLENYSSKLITLSEDEINTKLTEIQDWLAPCQKQSYGYDGLPNMINLLRQTSEEIQKQPMPLVTVLRLLQNLAIPSNTRFPDQSPVELKYKYALIELYSADCLPVLMTILQKMNDKMMRPWQQGLAQTCDQWNMILAITQPTIDIVKATLQYLIESRGALFKDVTNIPILLELHTVLCSAPVNSIYSHQILKIQKNIIDILMAYTQPVLNQADTEDVLSESLWTMTVKEMIKHTSKSPYCYMGGMLLLSELLPLPLPLQTREPLSEAEIQQTINVRKLWSAHLHPLTSQFIAMISNFLVSGCQPLQNIIRRVCWQMTDLSAPAAQMLIRCILDQFLDLGIKRASGDDRKDTDIFKEEIVASTLYNKILGLLSWLVTQASAKSALVHILKSTNKSDEKYKAFLPGILNQMNIVCDKTIHIQIQENILNIIMSVCDPEVTMVSNESTMTLPEQLANSLPDKEVICPTLKALLEHIERPEHNLTSVMPCVRTLVSLTFYDYGFFYVKRCIDQNPSAINKLLHRLNNCFSKDNPDCLSTLSSTIDLLNILVYIDPEESGVRTYTLSPTELQDILEWNTSEDHPLIELDKLLKNLDKDEVIENLLLTTGTILKVLNEPDITDASSRSEIVEVVLPESQSLTSLYNQRPVTILGNEDEEERLSPTAWLANPCNDELDAESDVVMTDVEEMCKRYCGDFNLEEELNRGVELAAGITVIKPKRLKDLRRSQEGINIYSRGRGGARRPFVAPMRGRGIMHGLVNSGRPNDPFRSRPANTSRPPSMHVDDFIKMEKHQGPEGSPHSTPPPPRRIEEPFRGRGRGGFDRGRGGFNNRGHFFTPPSSYGRHDQGPPRSGLMESRGRGRGRPFSRGSGDYRSNIDSNIRERFSPRGRAPHWASHKTGDPDPRFSSSFRGRRDPPGRHVRSFTK